MSIKCGNCKGSHETVAEVRECCGVRVMPGGEVERYLRNQQSLADGERAGGAGLDRDTRSDEARRHAYATGERAAERIVQGAVATRYGYDAPERVTGTGRTERMASAKMVKYILDIVGARDVPPVLASEVLDAVNNDRMSFHAARQFIDDYKDAPRKAMATPAMAEVATAAPERRTVAPEDLPDGMYRNPADGSIRKVYRTVHGANKKVAKLLKVLPEDERYVKTVRGKDVEVKAEFEYEGKRGLAGLTPEMRMTLADAEKYGAIYGVCIRCSATLTKETSIARAMGDTCASKSNWA